MGAPGTSAPILTGVRARGSIAWGPILAVVAAKTTLNLMSAGRYGWHRDELYYRAAGEHPQLGYPDFPPVTPLLAWVAEALFGASLVGLRSLAIVAGGATVVVTALMARDLGGDRWAQGVAALTVAAPLTLGANAIFQTVSFDQLAWALLLWAALRVLDGPTPSRWAWAGVAAGGAVLTKYTVLPLLAGLGLGFAATGAGRRALRGVGPVLAVVIALGLLAPNLWWQADHGWPSVDFFLGRNDDTRSDNPPWVFLGELFVLVGVLAWGLVVSGTRGLLADTARRPLGVAVVAVPILVLATGGKSYYAAPVVVAAVAAGAVRFERGARPAVRRWLPAAMVALAAVTLPLVVPVLPQDQMLDRGLDEARDDYAAMLGWPLAVAQVADAWDALPREQRSGGAIVAETYPLAGAIDLYGPGRGLPPAVSGHLGYGYWDPPAEALAATTVLVVGYDRAFLAPHCVALRQVGRLQGTIDPEASGAPLHRCQLRGTLGDLYPALRHDA